jgi:FkbM family methyltransferase
MLNIPRPAPFILVSSNHGTLIVSRNDYHMVDAERGYGVGFQILNRSGFDQEEVQFALTLLQSRRANYGDGVVAVDCGANIGVHTVEWARLMFGWGKVLSFEAQEKIFYALAGNVAINNCLNVTARLAAVGAERGTMGIPEPNYLLPARYGSFELRGGDKTEYIGQKIDYSKKDQVIDVVSIDSLELPRLDFMKIDVERMELEVLEGARKSIARLKPQMIIEVVKSDREKILDRLGKAGYKVYPAGMNVIAIHQSDPANSRIREENGVLLFA